MREWPLDSIGYSCQQNRMRTIDYLDAVKSSTFLVISIRADYVTYHYFLMVAKKANVHTLSG
jgi:hypothetical protein